MLGGYTPSRIMGVISQREQAEDAALLSAAPYQVSYGLDPGQDMSGYYTLSAAGRVGNEALSPQFALVKDGTAPQAEVYVPAQPALAFRVNWQGQDAQVALQHLFSSLVNSIEASQEQFADIFANYVVGNID